MTVVEVTVSLPSLGAVIARLERKNNKYALASCLASMRDTLYDESLPDEEKLKRLIDKADDALWGCV